MRFLLSALVAMLVIPANAQSLWRNFFTTNQNPIVDVVAGSNATVQASTVGSNLRRFTVNSTGSGTPQTNISYVAVTNAPWQQGSANLTNWGSISTNESAFLANNQVFTGSNYFTKPLTLSIASNTPAAGQVLTATSAVDAKWGDTLPDLNIGTLIVTNPPYLNLSNSTNYNGTNIASSGSSPGQVLTATATGSEWGNPVGGSAGPFTNTTLYGDQYRTNGVYIGSGGQILSNASGAVTISGGNVMSSGLLKGTNGVAPGVLTVATLPAAPSAGQICWASDVITSSGSGGFVHYDGAVWKTAEGVTATTSLTNFAINALQSQLSARSPISWIWSQPEMGSLASLYPGFNSGGASSGFLVLGGSTAGSYLLMSTGGNATGTARFYGLLTRLVSGDVYSVASTLNVSALSDVNDKYWCIVGVDNVTGATYPTYGVWFLYDMWNSNSHGQSYTNNWIAVSANNGSYSYADTGLAVDTSTTTPTRLHIVMTVTSAQFYTNGSLSTTLTFSTIASANMYHKHSIVNTAGTVAKTLNVWSVHDNYRHASRSY